MTIECRMRVLRLGRLKAASDFDRSANINSHSTWECNNNNFNEHENFCLLHQMSRVNFVV